MIARRLDEVLAQTDPFDLAQAVDRRVHALSDSQIHALIHDALPRMSDYYVQEFSRIQTLEDEASLRSAFAQSLKSNLRAIPLFGASFGESLLALTPSVGAVGFADEHHARRSPRWIAAGVVAAALVTAAAAGGHYVNAARSLAASATVAPMAVVPPPSYAPSPSRAARASSPVLRRIERSPRPAPPTAAPVVAAPAVAAQAPASTPPAAAPVEAPPAARVAGAAQKRSSARHLPVSHGSAVVLVPQHKPKHLDQVQSNGLDTTDMPEPYTDATPLPEETARPVNAARSVRLATPTPQPRRHGWLYRSIYHLDPFKPHPQPEGTP